MRPGCRLNPALLAFVEGQQKGLLPLCRRAASLPHPYGLFSTKAPVLGAAYRGKLFQILSINQKNPSSDICCTNNIACVMSDIYKYERIAAFVTWTSRLCIHQTLSIDRKKIMIVS
jgi:hypothetical protein